MSVADQRVFENKHNKCTVGSQDDRQNCSQTSTRSALRPGDFHVCGPRTALGANIVQTHKLLERLRKYALLVMLHTATCISATADRWGCQRSLSSLQRQTSRPTSTARLTASQRSADYTKSPSSKQGTSWRVEVGANTHFSPLTSGFLLASPQI